MITRKETYGNSHEFWFDRDVWVKIEAPSFREQIEFGCWEHQEGNDEDTYCSGNWWFDDDNPLIVIDYDGISELPHTVIQALESLGYDCNEII